MRFKSLPALLLLPTLAWGGNSLHVGQPAPALEMTTLDGRHINTRDLAGQVVLVTFWATWCGPCHEELPAIAAYAQAHAGQGLTVLALSLDEPDSLAQVKQLMGSYGFSVGLLAQAKLPGYGRIWRIPVSFVIDRQGRLVDNGWDDAEPVLTTAKLEQEVTPLLQAR